MQHRETAIHEAGHAVAHIRLGIDYGDVDIVANAARLGAAEAAGEGHVWSAEDAADMVVAYCAGYAALVAAGFESEVSEQGCWGDEAAPGDFDSAQNPVHTPNSRDGFNPQNPVHTPNTTSRIEPRGPEENK